MSLENLVKNSPKGRSKEFAGWKLKLTVDSHDIHISTDVRYKRVDAEPIIELEGELERVGPNGKPVQQKWEKHLFEDGAEISESQVKYVQRLPDGSLVEISPFQRTNEIVVKDADSIEVCNLEGRVAVGTFIPRSSVDLFAPESTYEVWGPGLLKLAEFLEKNKLAVLFPFTFGKFKMNTALMYPVRENGNIYMLMVLSGGVRKLSKPLTEEKTIAPAKTRPLLKHKAKIQLLARK